MRPALVIAVIAMIAVPSVAYPCGNIVELTRERAIQVIVQAERAIETGDTKRAARLLFVHIADPKLAARASDLRKVIALRQREPLDAANAALIVSYFEHRIADAAHPEVRHQAWLAEAYVAAGQIESARTLLGELRERDVMPDGFAYRTLAAISTGEERAHALDACRARMKKRLCTLPAAPKR